jgi:hypothetical protein
MLGGWCWDSRKDAETQREGVCGVGWMVLGLTQRREDAKEGSGWIVDGVAWVGMVLLFSLRLGVLSGAGVRFMTLPPETETSVASIHVCASSRPRVFVSRQ